MIFFVCQTSWAAEECRICRDVDPASELIASCSCKGSQRWVHQTCLNSWRMKLNSISHCDLCGGEFNIADDFRTNRLLLCSQVQREVTIAGKILSRLYLFGIFPTMVVVLLAQHFYYQYNQIDRIASVKPNEVAMRAICALAKIEDSDRLRCVQYVTLELALLEREGQDNLLLKQAA